MAMKPSSKFERMSMKPSQAMVSKPDTPATSAPAASPAKAPKAGARLNAMKKMVSSY